MTINCKIRIVSQLCLAFAEHRQPLWPVNVLGELCATRCALPPHLMASDTVPKRTPLEQIPVMHMAH